MNIANKKIHLEVARDLGEGGGTKALCGASSWSNFRNKVRLDRHLGVVTCKNCLRCAGVVGYISKY